MGILDGLKGLLAGSPGGDDPNAYWVYVQGGKCGEADAMAHAGTVRRRYAPDHPFN